MPTSTAPSSLSGILPPPVPETVVRVDVGGVALHCELYGPLDGPPLVLLGGLGADTSLWVHQIPVLSRSMRVIAFDNRGAGRSDKPDAPYPIDRLADDAAAVLDALGHDRADVLGASMGGFIAQAFALRHPHRLRRLVLACTSFGGPGSVHPDAEVLQALLTRHADPATHLRQMYDLFAGEAWVAANQPLVQHMIRHRLAHPMPPHAFARQAEAAARFDVADLLEAVTAPTLVTHGTADRVVPVENAYLLAERIPRTTLSLVPDAGHVFFMEAADFFNATVLDFLSE